jgi:FkbM family methyltransferase
MPSIRHIVETATARLVFRRRLPAEFGSVPIYVSPSAGLKFLAKRMADTDPTLFALLRAHVRPGQVIWDVGANVGLFSFAAAAIAGPSGRVFAFEPDTWLVQMLRRSARVQPASSAPVEILPVAVARETAFRSFNIAARSRAASFLSGYGSTQIGGVAASQTVMAVSLDWAACKLPPPAILKIDVEGAELEVLEGARELLTQHRPVVLCEVSGEAAEAVTRLLSQCGYRLFDGEHPESGEVRLAPWATVAVPIPSGVS